MDPFPFLFFVFNYFCTIRTNREIRQLTKLKICAIYKLALRSGCVVVVEINCHTWQEHPMVGVGQVVPEGKQIQLAYVLRNQ